MSLYRAIEMPSDEPVRYVGVYVLRWGDGQLDPEVGFAPVDIDDAIDGAITDIITDLLTRKQLADAWNSMPVHEQDNICDRWKDLIENAIVTANG